MGRRHAEADIEKALAYDPDFARKAFAAGSYTTGGKYGGGSLLDKVRDAIIAKTKAGYGTNAAATTAGAANGTSSTTLVGALQALGLNSDRAVLWSDGRPHRQQGGVHRRGLDHCRRHRRS